MNHQPGRLVTILRPYRSAYPDPLILQPGDLLTVEQRESEWSGWIWCVNSSGKAGWVPESFVERDGESCRMLREYNATELTVEAGDTVTVMSEESGWLWCATPSGLSGWIPAKIIAPSPLFL